MSKVEDEYKRSLRKAMWKKSNEYRKKHKLPLLELPKELRDD